VISGWCRWRVKRCKGRALLSPSQTKVIDKVYTYVWPPARSLLYLIEDVKGDAKEDAKRTQRGRKRGCKEDVKEDVNGLASELSYVIFTK